jgi:uncharacterized protein (TIGR01777 family)
MKITVTGATGFIGKRLVERLLEQGHAVHILGRTARTPLPSNVQFSLWNAVAGEPPEECIREADAIVHLAGEPVSQRWTPEVKRRIWSSRVDGTRHLVQALARRTAPLPVLISASAIGYYGSRGDETLTEESAPGSGFLAELGVAWEREALQATELGTRVVMPRIGIVLGRGGALAVMLPPFRAGLGGRIGDGRQWMSWIHLDDLVNLIVFALDRPALQGPVNATAPNPVRNAEFTETLARVLRRPAIFPVPLFGLRVLFGEMSEVMLASQRVLPKAAEAAGFKFSFPDLGPALKHVLA